MQEDVFSASYALARQRFLAAAQAAGAALHSDPHPDVGRDGEALALDLAVLGDANAGKKLLISSGCHGVEGYCGSGIQLALLQHPQTLALARQSGITLLIAHALNPYGFSHIRRVTQENVDLNRNFHDFSLPLPNNPDYASLHSLLLPEHWPPNADNQASIAHLLATQGMAQIQQAVTSGQYAFADGLFYGGIAPTWSHLALRRLLQTHAQGAAHLGWIDLHTGLGPSGHGERIFSLGNAQSAPEPDSIRFERASRWWAGQGATPLTRSEDGSSVSARLTGTLSQVAFEECPGSEITKITIEYGTVPGLQVLQALRAEQWLTRHPQAPCAMHQAIKQQLKDAFFTDTPEWKAQVLTQGLEAIAQALAGLAQEK
jgi:predicted deacylase